MKKNNVGRTNKSENKIDLDQILNRIRALEILIEESDLYKNSQLKTIGTRISTLKSLNVSTPVQMLKFENLFRESFPNFSEKTETTLRHKLTKGEINLVKFIYLHNNNFEISNQLGIGTESLRISIYRIRKKLGVSTLNELHEILKNLN